MDNGSNKPEGAGNGENLPGAAPVPRDAAPSDRTENGQEPDAGRPDTGTGSYQADGHRTIAPGPAEEADLAEPDSRGLTTDTGSSD